MIEYTVKVHDNGTREWRLNDHLHRTDGPAVEYANGDKAWYLNGKLHRIDGPACEQANGTKSWYLNGKPHRTDGPACEQANGDKYWCLNDKQYSKANWKIEIAKLNKQVDPCNGKTVVIDGKEYTLNLKGEVK